MRVLSEEEMITLSSYSHTASKSTYEKWLIAGPIGWAERMHPSFLSANAITLIGQLPLIILSFGVLWSTNGNVSPTNDSYRHKVVLGGILLEWFSLYDIMDGCRARRLKCGSPLGRIIDEGGDTIA